MDYDIYTDSAELDKSSKNSKNSKKKQTMNVSDKTDIEQSDSSFEVKVKLDVENVEDGDDGLAMSDICRGLRIDPSDMQEFIEQFDDRKLNKAIINLFEDPKKLNKTAMTDSDHLNKIVKLCGLSLYKRLKVMEARCTAYQKKSDEFNVKTRTYRNPIARRLSGQSNPDKNVDSVETNDDLANEANDLLEKINGPDYRMTRDMDMKMAGLIGSMLTPFGKKIELIKYKLMYYKPQERILVTKDNLESASHQLKLELDGISDILSPYMEDTKWKINIKRDVNFKVPESKLVFSNTVLESDIESDYLSTYLNMVIRYLERITDSKSVKYYIVEDNKYDIHWALITLSVSK